MNIPTRLNFLKSKFNQFNLQKFATYRSCCSPNGYRKQTLQISSKNIDYFCHHAKSYSSEKIPRPGVKPGVKDRGPVSWKGLLITFGIGGAMLYFMNETKKEKELVVEKKRTESVGRAALGGDWELVDTTGKLRNNKEFHGNWAILYFGFTHCPDICPDELEKLVEVVDKIDDDKSLPSVAPLFITVDPERDTVSCMAEYIKDFSSKIVGFTGSDEQIRQATRAYRVYFSLGPKDEDGGYIVDHTIIMYLINPEGQFIDYYGQNKTSDEMFASISLHMLKYAS